MGLLMDKNQWGNAQPLINFSREEQTLLIVDAIRILESNSSFYPLICTIFELTAFYIDFAWVYYTRQRVKLRNGGVVDSEDFRNSWLVNKVLSFRQRRSVDEEQHLHDEGAEAEHGADGERPRNNRWGARGISISADDTLNETRNPKPSSAGDDRLEGFLEDEEDTWEEHANQQTQHKHSPDATGNQK
ncbi:hypothetical protein AFLA_005644 [Aspergillus flavus NRRL3357]|nr:hypothetical protein AFLA_005644 [Aspergillus flavus NRRL3357]